MKKDLKWMLRAGGKEALDKIKEGVYPEVVLLDVVMPGMDGFELLGAIRKESLIPKQDYHIVQFGAKRTPGQRKKFGSGGLHSESLFYPFGSR